MTFVGIGACVVEVDVAVVGCSCSYGAVFFLFVCLRVVLIIFGDDVWWVSVWMSGLCWPRGVVALLPLVDCGWGWLDHARLCRC